MLEFQNMNFFLKRIPSSLSRQTRSCASVGTPAKFNVFSKISDGVGVESNLDNGQGKKRAPSKRVLALVDEILNLSLVEAADLCDVCQERLSERSGGIPLRAPFPHPGAMFGGMPNFGGMMPPQPAVVNSATPAPAATAEKAAEPVVKEEEKSIVSVKLVSYPADKRVGVIKEIRAITGLGLKESKELVEAVPKVIKRGLPREEAEALKKKIEGAGGVVEFS